MVAGCLIQHLTGSNPVPSTMADQKKEIIDYDLADIITQKPHEIRVGRKLFRLYPVTLAKTFRLQRLMDGLSIDGKILRRNAYLEALRLAETDKRRCCQILAIHATPNTYKDMWNSQAIASRRNTFETMSHENIASLLIYALTWDKTDSIIRDLGIDKERERLNKALEIKRKNGKNNLQFGGITIFGTFIGQLKEMGYSDNEILYEYGYTYLRLMIADKVTSLYLTDEELQELPTENGGKLIDGNDPAAFDQLKSALAGRGIKFND